MDSVTFEKRLMKIEDASEVMEKLPLAYPVMSNSALYRQQPEHFQVTEVLNFEAEGEGDHLYLYIQKRETNTDWLAKELARKAGLEQVDVGYAGRKDRFAVTRQWFSLHCPKSKAVASGIFNNTDYQVIEQTRHTKKLRKGELAYNQFKLQLIEFEGSYANFQKRLELIASQGFPNYFGPQRFGQQAENVNKALEMLSGRLRIRDRNKRSIYLSAARSYLFNLVLAKRIEKGCWLSPIMGDIFSDEQTPTITGPMFGDGKNTVTDAALVLETEVFATQPNLCEGIANSRIQWQRRPLSVIPDNVSSRENELGIEVEFSLRSGSYATSLLRELLVLKNN